MQKHLSHVTLNQLRLTVIVCATVIFALHEFLIITPGYAHDPIFIEDTQVSSAEGPYLPDGNISFALYGRFENKFDFRGFRSRLQAGDELALSLLIPNQSPEKLLTLEQLPTLTIERPDQSFIEIIPKEKEVFHEPFTRTSYLRLFSIREPAQTGVYHMTINGSHQGRFTVSIGTIEQFGTPVENVINRSSNLNRISDWYSDSTQISARQLAHDESKVLRFKDYLFIIFGIAGLTIISILILVKIKTTK